MKVSDIMKAKDGVAPLVDTTETIRDVVHKLQRENSGAVIVSDNKGTLDGMVTARDVVQGLAKHGSKLLDFPASALATTAIVTCSPNDNLTEVVKVMTERGLWHIPVKWGGRLVDVISIGDILNRHLTARRQATRALYGTAMIH